MKQYFCLDVYSSAFKCHVKRTIFDLETDLLDYQIYFEGQDYRADAQLYFFRNTEKDNFCYSMNKILLVEKYLVTNIFQMGQLIQLGRTKSLKVSKFGRTVLFNPSYPEIAVWQKIGKNSFLMI